MAALLSKRSIGNHIFTSSLFLSLRSLASSLFAFPFKFRRPLLFKKVQKSLSGATMGDKSIETLGSKIRFSSILDTLTPPPLPPTFPETMLIVLFLRLHRPQRLHNIELGDQGYQTIIARCK